MNVAIGDRCKAVIAEAVESGAYTSPEDVVTEAMRLFAAEPARYDALKASIAAALAEPDEVTEEEIDAAMAAVDARLRAEGID